MSMIVSDYVDIKVGARNTKHLRSLGFETKFGIILHVKVSDLLPNAKVIVVCRCDDCGAEWNQGYQAARKSIETGCHRCFKCTRNFVGKTMDRTNIIAMRKSIRGPLHHYWDPNKSERERYYGRVRWLSERTYRDNIDTINPKRLPRGRCGTPGAYQLDHKVSIKKCFEMNLPAEEASKLENLQMLSWEDNLRKWHH